MSKKRHTPAAQPLREIAGPPVTVEEEQPPFMPPHFSLDVLNQADLAQFAMRSFGRRPSDSLTIERQREQVKDWVRGGRPVYPSQG